MFTTLLVIGCMATMVSWANDVPALASNANDFLQENNIEIEDILSSSVITTLRKEENTILDIERADDGGILFAVERETRVGFSPATVRQIYWVGSGYCELVSNRLYLNDRWQASQARSYCREFTSD